jgi:cytochrome P450
VDRLILEEIAARRRDPELEERGDVMSALVRARDDDGEPMSGAELRDQLVTLLIAGHDTTATALAWTFERLVRHPESLERTYAEAEAGQTDYLLSVAKESLRVRPVLSFGMRRLQKDVEVAGRLLPEGTLVAGSFHLAHHDPEAFPDPLAFQPERFLDGDSDSLAWLPFGVGVHRCLGASFAMLEMKIVLSTVFARARFAVDDEPGEKRKRRAVSLAPARDGAVTMLRRSAKH